MFVSPGCPLGDKYLPRLGELAAEYGPKGIRFFAVASGAGDTRETGVNAAASHAASAPPATAIAAVRLRSICMPAGARARRPNHARS